MRRFRGFCICNLSSLLPLVDFPVQLWRFFTDSSQLLSNGSTARSTPVPSYHHTLSGLGCPDLPHYILGANPTASVGAFPNHSGQMDFVYICCPSLPSSCLITSVCLYPFHALNVILHTPVSPPSMSSAIKTPSQNISHEKSKFRFFFLYSTYTVVISVKANVLFSRYLFPFKALSCSFCP